MKKINNIFNFRNIFDMIAILSLTTLFTLEVCKIINVNFCNQLVFELIIVLLPSIITIVSISLSLSKEKVYGVSLGDFVKLRKNSIYSFTRMVIIMSICIGLYTIFRLLSANVTTIVLDAFAFCYSMIFSIQEIPVLVRNNKRLNDIVKYRYENKDKNELFLSQNSNKILYDIVKYMVLNDGIIVAYNSLKKNKNGENDEFDEYNSNLFEYLLIAQNEYLWDASEDLEVLLSNISGEYKNIEIRKAINTAFFNVEVLLLSDEFINSKSDFSNDKTHHLTRSVFALHGLCVNLKLEKKEKEKLKTIVIEALFSNYGSKNTNKIIIFTILMSVFSLKEGEIWFIRNLRDNDLYSMALFSFENCLLGLFISILLAHILNKNIVGEEKRNNILKFLSEPTNGLNSDGSSWNQLVARMIEFSDSKSIVFSLTKLINIYESIPEEQYSFMENRIVIDNSEKFKKIDIIDAWLEILLFSQRFDIDENDVEEVINKLDDNTKQDFISTLSKNWILDNQLNKNYQIKFLNHFNIHVNEVDENLYNKKIINFLKKYKNEYHKNHLIRKINNANDDIKEMETKIKNIFDKFIQENEFVDKTIGLSTEKSIVLSLKLEKENLKMFLEDYLKQISKSLIYFFKMQIESSANFEIINGYKLTEQQISRIQELKPNKHSYLYGLIYNSKEEMHKITDNIFLTKNEMFPYNFYFKDEAIKINVEYDNENSSIRSLTDEEIDNVIDNEYQLINGLYRVSEFSNDTTQSFLATREELKKLLRNRLMYAFIVIKEKIIIDKEGCLWFKFNINK